MRRHYQVGHPLLDQQHRRLEDHLLALHSILLQRGPDLGEARARLAWLFTYLRAHMRAEEELMQAWQFPGLAAHQSAHQRFLETLDADGRRWDPVDRADVVELIDVLQQWLAVHCVLFDEALASHLGSPRSVNGASGSDDGEQLPADVIASTSARAAPTGPESSCHSTTGGQL